MKKTILEEWTDMVEQKENNITNYYIHAEQKASDYFQLLFTQVKEKRYAIELASDLKKYLRHKRSENRPFNFDQSSSKQYRQYIQHLTKRGKLDNYLERSISYIYMRDLGRDITTASIQQRIHSVTDSLRDYLSNPSQTEWFSLSSLYRLAQNESLEPTFFWLMEKLRHVSSVIPEELDHVHAKRKLIKIIAGVLIHEIEELNQDVSQEERAKRLDKAVRIGYCYGLTYPFIDDLLDASFLSDHEKEQYADLIRSTLLSGRVIPFTNWKGKNRETIKRIYQELATAFDYLKTNQERENLEKFYQHAYLFFHSQEIDRNKELTNTHYTNEELYVPIILKSSSSRRIVRSFQIFTTDDQIEERMFYYGIYNQLADDLADLDQDLADGSVTPYTYYLTHHQKRDDLINPFALYWTVITYLIHDVFHSDRNTCFIILDRAINGLKRLKQRLGYQRYQELMKLFQVDDKAFEQLLQKAVRKSKNVAFFDKLLRDQMVNTLENEQLQKQYFRDILKKVKTEINPLFKMEEKNNEQHLNHPLIDAANYSLQGDGKRIRPILTWVMAIDGYKLDKKNIIPLLKAIEYMHTASLIFDDLPSQDNAQIRRGRKTVHEVYSSAVAELAGLFMTQRAVEEQTTLTQYDAETVLELIAYSTKITQEMCKGQIIDLESKGKRLTLAELNQLCFYKTGIGFEASIMMPAILAKRDEEERTILRKFAYHAGIAFQVKDDLLDIEGDTAILGKQAGIDKQNNSATFVAILGIEGAKKEMWNHYCEAFESLQKLSVDTAFFEQFLHYIINRKR